MNCQAIPVGATPALMPAKGAPEWRGWWVQLRANYDPNRAYRVIYNGAGCFDPNWFHAGADGLPYQNFDGGSAILVGLDYDTYADLFGCYDDRSPNSNDFTCAAADRRRQAKGRAARRQGSATSGRRTACTQVA